MQKQSDFFINSEGDGWYERNYEMLKEKNETINKSKDVQFINQILYPNKENINNILEIGCSSAIKLKSLVKYFNASGAGIDPSVVAIENAKNDATLADLDLRTGIASSLPYASQSCDLVYFSFCWYLLDRTEIFTAVAEADRVLKDGGFLAICDFDNSTPYKRPYHHKEGLFSYKNDYSKIFTGSGHYHLMAKESYSHQAEFFTKEFDERVAISILFKQENSCYHP